MGEKRKSGFRVGDREEKTMRKEGTGKGRGRGKKTKKCVELQLPENTGLPPETDHRHSPEIHSLLLPNIVHDSNNLQCQHILTKVWTKTK